LKRLRGMILRGWGLCGSMRGKLKAKSLKLKNYSLKVQSKIQCGFMFKIGMFGVRLDRAGNWTRREIWF
jgi:hypothetical protein